MFFYASKIIGFCLYPSNVIAVLCVAGLLLVAMNKWTKWGRRMLVSGVALLLIAGLSPLGSILILPLEQRFEAKKPGDFSAPPTGIILLGGAITSSVSANRERMTLNSSGERVTEFLELAQHFPDAKLLFTGGSASVIYQKYPEADRLKKYYETLGLKMSRLILEDKARNTHENAVFTKEILSPKPGERWLLVTSAYHMPRSVGCFRAAGFNVTPYPVDFRTSGWQDSTTLFENVSNGLRRTDIATREWIGLFAYWLTGRISSLLPGPKQLANCEIGAAAETSMAVHIIKLCVGVESADELTERQNNFAKTYGEIYHRTRMMPKRRKELLNGGSIYWVIKGTILVRQALTDIRETTTNDGIKRCDLILDPALVAVTPTPRRAFQGWRYLRADEAPADLSAGQTQILDLPPKMRRGSSRTMFNFDTAYPITTLGGDQTRS